MKTAQTHYDLLGVPRTARLSEIRAAYVRLMKQHHPDTSEAMTAPSGDLVPLINRAYSVLRDPRKKAVYDAQLAGRTVFTMSARPQRRISRLNYVPPPASPSRTRPWVFLVALALIVSVPILIYSGVAYRPGDESASALAWEGPASLGGPETPLPEATEIQKHARLSTTLSPDMAIAFSRECFETALGQDGALAHQTCIVFDEAFLYWRSSPNWSSVLPPYFQEDTVRRRHLNALAPLGADALPRIEELRRLAFATLLQDVNGSAEGVHQQDANPAERTLNS